MYGHNLPAYVCTKSYISIYGSNCCINVLVENLSADELQGQVIINTTVYGKRREKKGVGKQSRGDK